MPCYGQLAAQPFLVFYAAEFTTPASSLKAQVHLALEDITVDAAPSARHVYLKLKFQLGKGCTVILAKSDTHVCPMDAVLNFLQKRGSSPGSLFIFENGLPLTKAKLNSRLQAVLKLCGCPNTFSVHSFRVGAATTAASLGFPEHLIKAMGRWTGEAYKSISSYPNPRLLRHPGSWHEPSR